MAKDLQDTKYYTMGCENLYVATDHASLVGDQSLADDKLSGNERRKKKSFRLIYKIFLSKLWIIQLSQTLNTYLNMDNKIHFFDNFRT